MLTAIAAVVMGMVIMYFLKTDTVTTMDYSSCEVDYEFVNPRLGCRPPSVVKKHEYTVFAGQLNKYISENLSEKAVHISLYFRDLNNGPTFGLKEKEKFIPASLLKVPLLITYLSIADKDKSILNKQIDYTNKITPLIQQSGEDIPQLELNKSYTVDELLSRMIIYSDNVSELMLRNYLLHEYPDENYLIQTMGDLGLADPRSPLEETFTVKSYASLFRHLYNSSYLSPEMSEKALKLLSETKYTKGLVSGIPGNLPVAHKFGERASVSEPMKQLHDCGIVYYPGNPYLLCIMTEGTDFEDLAEITSTLSEKVFKEVESRKM